MSKTPSHLAIARQTLAIEADAIAEIAAKLDDDFSTAVQTLLTISGKAIVTGIGKSGLIARKIAATLASTGTPALFLHPTDAMHGDLGVISRGDAIIGISRSGTADEISSVLDYGRALGTPLIMLAGAKNTPLAAASDVCIEVSVSKEACPLNLAPTASATATLALGDALAMALLSARGFTPEDFARTHPQGALGRRLLLRVSDVMCAGDDVPVVLPDQPITDAMAEMSAKRLGMTTVADDQGILAGIFTDGDLRRCMERGTDLAATPVSQAMTSQPETIGQMRLAAEAAERMRAKRVNQLPVLDKDRVVGALTIQMLLANQVA